jgi:F-type H+-transporting ATPase subunit epsilon
MRLVITTPTEVVEDIPDIRHVRAEDETGAFGIEPGHADFTTVLPVSIVTWRDVQREGFVVVRGGVLTVRGGDKIEIAARGAWREDTLATLGQTALEALQRSDTEEEEHWRSEQRMHLATIRQIERLLRGKHAASLGAPRLEPRGGTDQRGAM